MIIILSLTLMLIFVISLWSNKGDVISPSVLFSFSFFASVSFAVFYRGRWQLSLEYSTFFVIAGGVLLFSIVSYLTKRFYAIRLGSILPNGVNELDNIHISNSKLNMFILFEMITIIATVFTVVKLVGGSISNFPTAVTIYRDENMFGESWLTLPRTVNYMRTAVDAAAYWFGYVLMNNYVISKKINARLIVIILLSAISSYILGGRNGIIDIIVAMVSAYFLVIRRKSDGRYSINFKMVAYFLLIGAGVLSSFESLLFLIGRSGFASAKGLDYLAVYIAAPIKNLNTFLQESHLTKEGFESQTFINFMNWIGPKIDLISAPYKLYLPFRSINSLQLGNVYTTFYPYIYDFGYKGVPILISVMAVISQSVFERAIRAKKKLVPPISSLIYIYIYRQCL